MDSTSNLENEVPDETGSAKIIRSKKRIFEKDLDESQTETPQKVQRIETADDYHKYQDICENINRKKKELQHKLEIKNISLKNDLRLRRQLRQKDEQISCLEQRIAELEGSDNDSKSLTPSLTLLETIRKLGEENEALKLKMIDTEAKLNIYKKDCCVLRSQSINRTSLGLMVFDGKVVPRVLGTDSDIRLLRCIFSETETKLKQLQTENESFSLKLAESEKKRVEDEKHFRKEKDRLENEFLNEHINFTEHLANTPSLIVVENKIERPIDMDCVNTIQDKLSSLTSSYLGLQKLMADYSVSVKEGLEDTASQIQNAIIEVDSRNKELVNRYTNELQLRKMYHNQLVELRGNIRVYCRVRPPTKEDGSTESLVSFDNYDDGIINVNSAKGRFQQFHLDKVFPMDASQEQVFEEVRSLVKSAIDGFHVCIFAYGQTGSGKTYTMEGIPTDPGVNQRALKYLFEETQNSVWKYEIEASMLEIYNETIRDLLDAECDDKTKLEIKMKPEGGLYVPGLLNMSVKSLDEVNQIFESGRKNRSTAKTGMNDRSSRSHCLLLLSVVGVNPITGNKTYGRLNLVDLAGSERTSKTQVEGARLQEAKHINKSLSCLGDVINALKNKHNHVPYRNSKLTFLLQESLDGDSKTLMILQISPVEKNISETIFTLNFGQRGMSAELGPATKKFEEGKDRTVYESEGSSVHGQNKEGKILSALRCNERPWIKRVRWDDKGTPSSARRLNCETPKSPGTSLTPSTSRTPNLPKSVVAPSKLILRHK